jgi:hypothetical protein
VYPNLYDIALYCYLRAAKMVCTIVSTWYLAFWAALIQMHGIAEM